VKRVLSLPGDWQVQGLVTIGYATGPAPVKPRKALADLVFRAAPDRGRRWPA
jgi:hypothetical protein